MATFYAISLNLIVIFGALSALTGIIISLSCRCFPAWKAAGRLVNNEKYRKFFKIHCHLWWVFLCLVAIHLILVILYFFVSF